MVIKRIIASTSYSLLAKKKATPAKKQRRQIALTAVTKEEEKVVNKVFQPKPEPKPKVKPEPKPKVKPEPKTKAKPEPMSLKPKRRKNIQVLAITDGLCQILDAYDGDIDS